jgi:hypothetical protein
MSGSRHGYVLPAEGVAALASAADALAAAQPLLAASMQQSASDLDSAEQEQPSPARAVTGGVVQLQNSIIDLTEVCL